MNLEQFEGGGTLLEPAQIRGGAHADPQPLQLFQLPEVGCSRDAKGDETGGRGDGREGEWVEWRCWEGKGGLEDEGEGGEAGPVGTEGPLGVGLQLELTKGGAREEGSLRVA